MEKDNTPCIPATDWTLSVGARERHENAYTVIVWKGERWRAKEEEEEGSPLGQDLSLEEEEDGVLGDWTQEMSLDDNGFNKRDR